MTLSRWINSHMNSISLEVKKYQPISSDNLIRLAVITQFFPPDYAATGQLIEELVKQLETLGVDIDVFTGQPGYAFSTSNAPVKEKSGNLLIKRSRTSVMFPKRIRGKAMNGVMFTIRAALHLIRHFRERNTLLLTTAPPFLPVLGYVAKLFLGMSYVCIVYDLYPDIAIALDVIPQNNFLAKIWQFINRLVWKNAKGIIVLSPAMKERIASICPEIENKISVIHSWADPNAILPIPKHRNWFALKHNLIDKFTVLYSGNMGRCHDMTTILEAVKILKDKPIQFIFIGGGAKRKEFIAEVNRLGLTNCKFLPYVDKEEIPYSMTACDLSLVTIDEGFESLVAPSKFYPALASGRPVAAICPKDCYLRTLISEAKCGETFDNGDEQPLAEFINKLSENKQLTENMGSASRRYLELFFTPEVIAKEYLIVLQKGFM